MTESKKPEAGSGKKAKVAKKRKRIPNPAKYPRHTLEKALRVPKAILEQNAGRQCSDREAAEYVGVSYNGPFQSEIASAKKYGLLESPEKQQVLVTDLAKAILRPQSADDEIRGIRESVLQAPDISDVYQHYRGENIPGEAFFENALVDSFKIPREKVGEFSSILFDNLSIAKLIEDHGRKRRVLDTTESNLASKAPTEKSPRIKNLERQ